MQRVYYTELDFNPEEGDANALNGEPFTGVAERMHPNGELAAEWTYDEGWLWGPRRFWSEEGRLQTASYIIRGWIHGALRRWHKDGAKAEIAVYRYGIKVRSKKWNQQGKVIEDFTRPAGDWQFDEMREREATYRDIVEA